ncbi:putative tail accessory fiber/neck passage structure [Lactococcus phage 712]|uniref:Putative tail accessory fiber/neck passage structure n=1 Tax=Lactococcus phage 712 TaxID=2892346 RepID=Q09WU2_9CAUD|nr:tail protein [Lactococcus phage 712]ABB77579.1 putative tail accessory fiber/neck passage structure [Lactococcus phage 712]
MPDGANHVAFAYSADGKDRFTTVYPNFNLLDGTKDFSGYWGNAESWSNDGTYKGLAVKKRHGSGQGIYKTFTAPADGTYTFSSYFKSSGSGKIIRRWVNTNGLDGKGTTDLDSNIDWTIDTFSASLKVGDKVFVRYEITSGSVGVDIWNAGHKWEKGSTATPYMLSFSEVTVEDYPSYIGTYTDNDSNTQSTDPVKYTWKKIVE